MLTPPLRAEAFPLVPSLKKLTLRLNSRVISDSQIKFVAREMKRLGCTPEGIRIMLPKANTLTLKLENVTRLEANILKQAFLSVGGDAVVHKHVVTEQINPSDILLVGTIQQFRTVCMRLQEQPWSLPKIAHVMENTLQAYFTHFFRVPYPGGVLTCSSTTLIMGILNVTPDSFFDGGHFLEKHKAVERALQMVEKGANIIDVGGESTRPGSKPVSAKEELKRVLPVVEALARHKIIISVDTYKAKVAQEVLAAGASMINDVTGLSGDVKMAFVVAKRKVPIILMHLRGTPRTMQKNPQYQDVMSEIITYLRQRIYCALEAGISSDRILVDPGIGFGKKPEHNLEILKRLYELKSLGCPIVMGTSRKSFIGYYLTKPSAERLNGTLATVAMSVLRGAQIVRVHDVKEAKDVIRMTDMLK